MDNKGKRIGDLDQEGFINSLDKDGMTITRSIFELIGNSIDAKCTNITFDINNDNIQIIDNGKGMNRKQAENAFSMYHSNHSNDYSIGVTGYGLKASLKKLSNNSICKIYTHSEKCDYLEIVIDWDKMIKEGKYTHNINLNDMKEEEIKLLNEKHPNFVGTIINIPFNQELANNILQQFKLIKAKDTLTKFDLCPDDRIDWIFGNFDINIYCNHEELKEEEKIIKFYKPHNLSEDKYLYKKTYKFSLYLNKNDINDSFCSNSPINSYLSGILVIILVVHLEFFNF